MLPVIAIVGRPNVGKSTLFNRLTRTQNALVANLPGVTRDRLYGEANFADRKFIVVDTGGMGADQAGIEGLMEQQAWTAINEANAILFVLDARSGLTPADEIIAQKLREIGKPIFIVANKIDGLDPEMACNEFYRLGLGEIYPIAAAHGAGVADLVQIMLATFPEYPPIEEKQYGIKIAIIGRPNVGKSTLVNRMLGEERVLVYDLPGTTRDSIYIPFQRYNTQYTLIDTAGVRRRRGITEALEKFSVIKSLQAIEAANVVVIVMDAQEGVTEQDLRLLGFVIDVGKSLIIVMNKWDRLPTQQREKVKNDLDRRLQFANFARIHFISALHGSGVGDIFNYVEEAYAAATKELATPELTRILQAAVEDNQPPSVHGRYVKLRYAHAGGHNPPVIVIHGRHAEKLPAAYQRYLANYFRSALKLIGTPVRIVLNDK